LRPVNGLRLSGIQIKVTSPDPLTGCVFVDQSSYDDGIRLKHWLDLALAFNPKTTASKQKGS
jgi:hypothetical protein